MGKRKPYYKRKTPKTEILSTRITKESKRKLEDLADALEESQSEALANIIDFAHSHFFGKSLEVKFLKSPV